MTMPSQNERSKEKQCNCWEPSRGLADEARFFTSGRVVKKQDMLIFFGIPWSMSNQSKFVGMVVIL